MHANERRYDKEKAPCVVCGKLTQGRDADEFPYCQAHHPDVMQGEQDAEKDERYEHGGDAGGA